MNCCAGAALSACLSAVFSGREGVKHGTNFNVAGRVVQSVPTVPLSEQACGMMRVF